MFASGPKIIETVFNYNNGEVFQKLFEKVDSKKVDVAKEAIWAITNAITESDFPIRLVLINRFGQEIIHTLITGLKYNDAKQLNCCF